jgi:ankyrin repeat protein
VVQLLVKYGGININLKDSLGRMLLSIAKAYRDATIVQLLLECESNSLKSIN